ncbi:8175_t:CDS:1, partial [Racocetra fulgida]
MEPQRYNFLSHESFDYILENFVSQRKNKRCLIDLDRYHKCLNVLKYPNDPHNLTFKYWFTHTFKILLIDMTKKTSFMQA